MAIPPPPGPPRPPPPPAMGGLKLSGGTGGGVPSTDARSALLQSIQKGTKLKKTVTVDKSGPATSGKVVGESNSSPPRRINNNSSSASSQQQQRIANGGPKLAGLFEGMASMPKLKPVNSRDNVPSTRLATSNSIAQENKTVVVNNNNNNNNNGPMDFNTELTKHLAQTLKRQKKQQQHIINATEANLRTNRGPPPKPPVQKNISSSTSDSVLEKSSNTTTTPSSSSSSISKSGGKASSPTLSEGSNSSSSSTMKKNTNLSLSIGNSNVNSGSSSSKTTPRTAPATTTPTSASSLTQNNILPNKSTLFGTHTNSSSNTINSSQNQNQNPSSTPTLSSSLSSSSSPSSSSKPVVNHGKPNCAPKPPGIQQLISNGGGKPTVSRHHSMKSPRSPPISIATSSGPFLTAAQHFGTLRGPPQQFNQSQESITSTITMRQAPNPPIGRPTEAPPKPPSTKPAPPPIPARSVSNTNLTNLPLSTTASSCSSSTNLNTSFGSTNNVSNVSNISAIKEQLKSQISYTGSISNVSTMKLPSSNTTSSATISSSSATPTPGGLGVTSGGIGGSTGKLNSPIHSKDHHQHQKGSNLNGLSPPVPSHRLQPAPDPPQRQIMNNSSLVPPKPPERHSSIRSVPTAHTTGTGTTTNLGKMGYNSQIGSGNINSNSVSSGSGSGSGSTNIGLVNRLVVDIESKYGTRFHNVTEFPPPPPFLSIPKIYPSRNENNAENRKPRAPSPPSNRHQHGCNMDQMNEQKS